MIIENKIRELLLEFHKTVIEKENPEKWFKNNEAYSCERKIMNLLKREDRLKVPHENRSKSQLPPHQFKLFYSVSDGGDGSVYPHFFESAELCELDQEYQDPRFAECCDGFITIESDSEIRITDEEIKTAEMVLEELNEDISWSCGDSTSDDYPEETTRTKEHIAKVVTLINEKEDNNG